MFLILLIAGIAIVTRADSKAMDPPPLVELAPDGSLRIAIGPGRQNSGLANTSSSSNPHPSGFHPDGRPYPSTVGNGCRNGVCPSIVDAHGRLVRR